MITGDHKLTAKTIGQELGFPVGVDNILEGDKLAKISESQLKKLAPKISIYSRVAPQDKLKIVKAWQDRDAVVAMTGDGVNDAPALQAADIGVAPGSGTDVAKEAADVILLDNNFSTIVAAVRQGRVIYDNIKKVILMLLSDSFTEMIMIISSLVMGWPLPLLASQILWINLVDDSFPALALTQDPEESGIMSEKPRPRNAPFLDSERKVLIGLISVVSAIMALFAFWWSGQQGYDLDHSRTMAFAIVATSTLVYVFGIKSLRRPVWRAQVFNNPLLVMAVVLGFVLQVVAVYWNPLQNLLHTTALSLSDWALILGMDLALLAMVEITKGIFLAKEGELKLLKA
jgi:P-type Ca2+ transporter type 2C